jgi:hypothetical protein
MPMAAISGRSIFQLQDDELNQGLPEEFLLI